MGQEPAGRGSVWPARLSFRLNGAALRASPGSTPAGLAKHANREMEQNSSIRVGQMRCAKWATPDARTHRLCFGV